MSRSCPPNSMSYTVQAGDTFYSLSSRFNTTVQNILALNPGVDPNALQIGQTVCVPFFGPAPPCVGGRYYDIRSGDTFYLISQRFNIPLNTLIRANPGINPNRLQIGQTICLPGTMPTGPCPEGAGAYVIRPGDTLYRIAIRYNVSLDRLIAVNHGVDPDALQVGQTICIPD